LPQINILNSANNTIPVTNSAHYPKPRTSIMRGLKLKNLSNYFCDYTNNS